ncbi:MAG: nuclear transport factor 2 family protein [Spirochaetales bacterium]
MSPIAMNRMESGIRLAIALFERLGAKANGIPEILSDDCILEHIHSGTKRDIYKGKERVKQYYEDLRKEKSNLAFETEEIIGFGHRCVIRWKCVWTDEEGIEKAMRGMDLMREKYDLLCEILSYSSDSR